LSVRSKPGGLELIEASESERATLAEDAAAFVEEALA
jgi:hypothetical protein